MSNYEQLYSYLLQEIPLLAQNILGGYTGQATKDAQIFLQSLETDLKTWIEALSKGEISPADLEFLLRGKRDLAKLQVLKQAGLAKVAIEQFRDALLGVILKGIQASF